MSHKIDPFSSYSDISIDYNNPIVNGLTDVFIPSRNAYVNLTGNVVCPDTSTGSLAATVFGNSYNYPDDSPVDRAKDPFTGPSLNEFTLVSVVNPVNSTADHGLLTVAIEGTAGWSVLHWADTDSSLLRPALGASSDGGTTNDIAFGTADSIIVGKLNTVVASRKVSGEFRFSVNGVYSTAAASSLVPDVAPAPVKEFRLAARSSTTAVALEGDAFAFFIFNRQLSQSESISLSKDPFQIFKPTTDPVTAALTAATQPAASVTVSIPDGVYSLAGEIPVVVATANIVVGVPDGVYSLAGEVPTLVIETNVLITVPSGVYVLNGFAPIVIGGATPDIAFSVSASIEEAGQGVFGLIDETGISVIGEF